ncbi:hypothetical protein DEFDS_1530 [Deferribacter desulfuricans SSM1]|uniref:histidine kinase n=1 Tax=Deferribacter desulfuricans (strain DSM 14783 / JCM 11476 / NBRC 101012 / SSM1) TaxID=639282 RepID=D3PEG7_DEFDS|nr:HAMP domain-containing sensor histidine kinase [Deferribacter desulfuricans]BAI80990.1 hypothetical protein DEFDS_1530 [Deferribacter desulfuricans SSM1]
MYKLTAFITFFVFIVYLILKYNHLIFIADVLISLYVFLLTFFVIKKLSDKEKQLEEKIEELNQTASELKAANEELHALNQQLLKSKKDLETYKSYSENLVLNMNHEIKTPLNSILGFTSLLLTDFEEMEKEDIVNSLKMIDESAKRLNSMINNVIQLAKKPLSEVDDEIICDSPKYIIDSIISTIKGLIKNNDKLIFDYFIPENFPKLSFKESVLNSLLLNISLAAVLNTDKGMIELHVYEKNDDIFIEIKDSGKRIDIEKIKNYFVNSNIEINTNEPEYRLYIAKQLAVKNDIDMKVDSNEYNNKYTVVLKRC